MSAQQVCTSNSSNFWLIGTFVVATFLGNLCGSGSVLSGGLEGGLKASDRRKGANHDLGTSSRAPPAVGGRRGFFAGAGGPHGSLANITLNPQPKALEQVWRYRAGVHGAHAPGLDSWFIPRLLA
ncbi:unnamed protein product [Symbiodinium natans]|uniref:Uncharacterized protein n=1 Tax=Symbiodinium natans TaxID=878477 RepID=A0A812Q7T2_9DINO|nr:unnamed protein product [Symbiodinium natans]